MTPAPARSLSFPPPLVPVSGLLHRVLGAAVSGVSEGSLRNARAALVARQDLTRHSAEVIADLQKPYAEPGAVRGRSTA